MPMLCGRDVQGAVRLHVTPNARKNELLGWQESPQGEWVLKVKVSAVPEDGKANAAVLKLLAKELGVAKSRLTLASGEKSRYKLVEI